MEGLKLVVPTYYGNTGGKPEFAAKDEFDEPSVPVLIREADGVRLVLGTHDFEDLEKPEIQIERRPNGWLIFLNPIPGGDTTGLVYFLDDGRSFLVPDGIFSERIQVLDRVEEVPGIDDLPNSEVLPDPSIVAGAVASSLEESAPRIMVVAPPNDAVAVTEVNVTFRNRVRAAIAQAELALASDSNDDEHDALLALVEALDGIEAIKS